MSDDPERALARFAVGVDLRDLPASVRDRVGLVVADTVGAVVGGTRLPEVADLAARLDEDGDASVLGTGHAAAPGPAALVNGTAGTSLELDEGHRYAGGHPAIHALPAALAAGEAADGEPADWLAGFVAGYEVGTRVARACAPLDPTYHMHGLWGAVGATAAVARTRGLSLDRTAAALRMAPNHALHTRFEAATEGATVRNTYAGTSNLSGHLVATQAEAGFSGLRNATERHLARVVDGPFDADALTADLGERWEVERGYFKRHAACRFTHPALDAVTALAARHDLDPASVAAVRVETYDTAARLTPTRPANPLQAKFSIPFAVATALRRGHTRMEAFDADALDEATFELAERVSVTEHEEFTARAPDRRGARVTVVADGSEHAETVEQARGGTENPFDEADLREKFDALVAPTLGDEGAATLWRAAREPASTPPRRLGALATPD
ncbi:MAG: MmgE/PrpD family protein [Haloferacaceae archaeon]